VHLKFDGNLTDSSGAGIITSVTPNAGFSPTYAADRFGVASRAVVFTGSQSLQLVAAATVGNSYQALGLRNAGGTNTSFTLSAWVFHEPRQRAGYSTVFGNTGKARARRMRGFSGNGSCTLVSILTTPTAHHVDGHKPVVSSSSFITPRLLSSGFYQRCLKTCAPALTIPPKLPICFWELGHGQQREQRPEGPP
jgi:hypothetical protein